jgi:hypothetical protein
MLHRGRQIKGDIWSCKYTKGVFSQLIKFQKTIKNEKTEKIFMNDFCCI